MELTEFFKEHPRVALGFSGGVDSSYVLYAAVQAGATVQPYFIKTAFQPDFELEDARRLADQLGVQLKVVEHDILTHEAVVANPANRCYHCKTALFGLLRQTAAADGFTELMDGTNASDDAGDRPGMKALAEMQVLSPLRLCGLTKDEIRRLSKAAGLFTWDKPSYACLATRIPTGTALTVDALGRVEQAEGKLTALGFSDFRVRVYHDAARIQLKPQQLPLALEQREAILTALQPIFPVVLLDLVTR